MSSAVGIKICAIIPRSKKCKSFIKKKKKHDKIVLLGKDKLNIIEVLISKSFIDSYISHDQYVSVDIISREYNEMKKEIKNSVQYIKAMETYCVSCKKNTANENSSVKETKQNGLMLLSNCAVCGNKKSTFLKNKEHSND